MPFDVLSLWPKVTWLVEHENEAKAKTKIPSIDHLRWKRSSYRKKQKKPAKSLLKLVPEKILLKLVPEKGVDRKRFFLLLLRWIGGSRSQFRKTRNLVNRKKYFNFFFFQFWKGGGSSASSSFDRNRNLSNSFRGIMQLVEKFFKARIVNLSALLTPWWRRRLAWNRGIVIVAIT